VTGLCNTMQVREANNTDFDVLVTLLRDSFRDVAERFGLTIENCSKSPAFYTEERLEDDFRKGFKYYILEENDKAFGCVALERAGPDFCYLGRLAVLPKYRRSGCGKALVNHIFDQARKMGVRRIEIGIIAKDTKLKNWYRKFGFIGKGTKRFDHLPFEVAFMYADVT
jgi:N-acetylglutamate synthase-like GNAT family acetyltransferase